MKKILLAVTLLLAVFIGSSQQKVEYNLCDEDFSPLYLRKGLPANAVYLNKNASPEARSWDVISRLSFEEKLTLTGGWKGFYFPSLPRLGLSPVSFADASQGIRKEAIQMHQDACRQ